MCTVSENNFNSKTYINIQIKDVNLNIKTLEYNDIYRSKYVSFINNSDIPTDIMLKRDDISEVYRFLKQMEHEPYREMDWTYASRKVSSISGRDINYARFRICIDVLSELDLIEILPSDQLIYKIITKTQKTNLMLSPIWKSVSQVI